MLWPGLAHIFRAIPGACGYGQQGIRSSQLQSQDRGEEAQAMAEEADQGSRRTLVPGAETAGKPSS